MNNTTIAHNGRRKIGVQEKNLEMVALESTHSAANETDFILSDTEKTFQAETKSKSYGVDNGFSKCVRLLLTFSNRILSCLNGFAGSDIDIHRIESIHNVAHFGLRKWDL